MSVRRSVVVLGLLSQAWVDRTSDTAGADGMAAPVSEPATWMLMLCGLGFAVAAGLRRPLRWRAIRYPVAPPDIARLRGSMVGIRSAPAARRGRPGFEQIQSYLLFFLAVWWIALIALVAGAFGGRHSQRLVATPLVMVIIYVQVWVVVGLSKLAFGYLGYMMQLSKNVQVIYPEFVMPLAAGIYVARQLLRLDAQKHGRLRADSAPPPRRPY